jgi:mono/diheme cytochrome c family protein
LRATLRSALISTSISTLCPALHSAPKARARTTSPLKRASACWLAALVFGLASPALLAKDPQTLYMMECQGCHLSDGAGGLNNIPTLKNNVANFPIVAGGREFLVQVPGVALSVLSDQELADVLNWMLSTFGPLEATALYPPYTPAEVATLRKQPMEDIVGTRAGLVARMVESGLIEAP